MKVLCLTDFPIQSPDRWIWNHLTDQEDEVDFLWTAAPDLTGRLGKLLTRYPPFWRLAIHALHQSITRRYDLLVAWESKVGIPLAILRQLTGRRHPPFVILTFTPGETPPRLYALIRIALKAVDHVTVLTQAEIEVYSRLLDLPTSQISLCLLGTYDLYPDGPPVSQGASNPPYIHASGRSARDYRTLARAAEDLPAEVVIHGRGYNFTGLAVPPNVSIGELVPREEYHRIVRDAAVEVVPLQDIPAPVGSSQVVFAMMMGKAIVATRTGSTIDYIEHGVTGLLVRPGDADEMRAAIRYLLDHRAEAEAMGRAARRRFEERHTFEAFAHNTHAILRQVYLQTQRE